MTLEEAKTVGDIVADADGGCTYCVLELIHSLNGSFSKFTWSYNKTTGEVNVESNPT